MTLRLGDTAPDFIAETTVGELRFHDWIGESWAILLSHPKDFTPVCTTELGYLARLKPEFDARGVKILGLSVDTVQSHRTWLNDIAETQGIAVTYPIVADANRVVANLYGMVHPHENRNFTVRTTFIVDPKKKIRHTTTYPHTMGRNFDELLRVIDSLQLTENHNVSTPVNWQRGEDVIIPISISNDDAKDIFPSGWKELKPYLRLTPDPSI